MTFSTILYSNLAEYLCVTLQLFSGAYSQAYTHNIVLLITPSVRKAVRILTFYF